jgi:hypothetical protein
MFVPVGHGVQDARISPALSPQTGDVGLRSMRLPTVR